MPKRDPDEILSDLKAADDRVDDARRAYESAVEERSALMVEASDFGLSRGAIARELGISPNRVQQILDRARARKHGDA
jgi:DNA-directed RNA polymerase specialized sigma24 family protein